MVCTVHPGHSYISTLTTVNVDNLHAEYNSQNAKMHNDRSTPSSKILTSVVGLSLAS